MKNNHELVVRCSSLSDIMGPMKGGGLTDPQQKEYSKILLKKPEDRTPIQQKKFDELQVKKNMKPELPQGAKTYVINQVKQNIYGYKPEISAKQLDKGNECEEENIALLNHVLFTDHEKNTERKTEFGLTGECDIDDEDCDVIKDIKSSWSLETFPALVHQAEAKVKAAGYDWQGIGYMMLWKRNNFHVVYCMSNTPLDLCIYEQSEIHVVDHIDPTLRVTIAKYKRDLKIEEQIKERIIMCQDYYDIVKKELLSKNC